MYFEGRIFVLKNSVYEILFENRLSKECYSDAIAFSELLSLYGYCMNVRGFRERNLRDL